MSHTERVGDLPWPGLYLLRGAHRGRYCEDIETLHVMSRHARGEVRGYAREKGERAWTVRLPNHSGDWPEMDAAVANLTGDPANGARPSSQQELFR